VYDQLKRFEQIIFDTLSVLLVLFYSYAAVVQPASTQYHRGIYVIITYVLVFLLYQSKSKLMRVVDYILILLSIVCIGYWILNFEAINYRTGAENAIDKTVAVVGVLIGIELARRVVGNAFVIIGTVMILYGVYGPYAPDLFAHPGDTFPNLCTTIYYMSDGVFGIMANVLATYVILFVLFGAFLEKSGAQKFFIDWPLAAVGHKIGGPAKVSVIASGLFGSISGSAIANTVSTGTFTIPMMKKAGFRPHIAGGIEPAASIGGMFMPPIMGAGGFIMAELTGVPYSRIMLVGLFPAFMYFFSVFVMVHYEAKMHNIVGERSEHSAMEILKKEWFLHPAPGDHHHLHAFRLLAGLLGHPGTGDLHYRQLQVQGNPHRLHPGRGHGPGPGNADDIAAAQQDGRARGRQELQPHGFRKGDGVCRHRPLCDLVCD
jgi:TRAP transporter 4TM/12TM fusion protein